MATGRKRVLLVEGDGDNTGKDKEKKLVTSLRPPKPVSKRRRTTDSTSQDSSNKTGRADLKGPSKGKRQAWTTAAIDAFYEGLLLYGKEFVKILKHMQSKQKKLNDPAIANLTKNQVRFFYYRNWHKVEPLLIHPNTSEPKRGGTSSKGVSSSSPVGDLILDGTSSGLNTPVDSTDVKVELEVKCVEEIKDDANVKNGVESAELKAAMVNGELKGDTEGLGVVEGYLDSSMEDLDLSSPVVTLSGESQEQEAVKASESPGGERVQVSGKEQVQASPTSATDKTEGKVKDTVLVNGTRQSLDLVALICYNKLRKKNSLGDHNISRRLSELVFHGVTSIPSKGVKGKRKAQIRIPNCGAFRAPTRKPAGEDQSIEGGDSTPSTVADSTPSESVTPGPQSVASESRQGCVVELRPLNSSTWRHVQGLSHNPRVRLHPTVCESLRSLRDYLALRWNLDKGSLTLYSSQAMDSSLLSHHHSSPSHTAHSHTSHKPTITGTSESTNSPKHTITTSSDLPTTTEASKENILEESGSKETVSKSSKSTDEAVFEKEENNEDTWRDRIKSSQVELDSTWKDLLVEDTSKPIQLCYEIQRAKESPESPDRLRAALKLVQFFLKNSPSPEVQTPPPQTPVKRPPVTVHQSPKVMEYVQSLRKISPRKSPLSKYRRLKLRSPLKQTTPSRTVKRVQLSFDSTPSTTISTPSTPTTSLISSPKVLATYKVGDKTSTAQVVQLTSPESIGSFANFKLQSLLPKPSPPAVTSSSTPSTPTADSDRTLMPTPGSDRTLMPAPGSSGGPLGLQTVSLNSATVLQPGVHRIQPRGVVTASQLVTTPPLIPKPASTDRGPQTQMPIVSTLKPFKKPRRVKKTVARPGHPHQLVPRPLPFLRDVTTTMPTLTPSQVSVSSSPVTGSVQRSSPRKTVNTLLQNQQLMLQLFQSFLLQQQKTQSAAQQQAQSLPTQPLPIPTQPATTEYQSQNVNEQEIQSAVLDSFLNEGVAANDSTGGSKMFHTSSDTVNKLLRGLGSVKSSESIQKLSEETADVLPTFAKALGNSLLSAPTQDNTSVPELPVEDKLERIEEEELQGFDSIQTGPATEVPPCVPEADCQLPLQQENSLTDILGTLTDSNFKQVADNGDVFEHIDFTDMFTQLKEVMTPEKSKNPDRGEDSQSSFGNILDYVNCPSENKTPPPYNPPVDPMCRTFLEEASVDFIQKFREIASSMEGHSSST